MILENLNQILIYSILGLLINSYIPLRSALHFTAWRHDNDIVIKSCVYLQKTKNSNCKQQSFSDREKNDDSEIIYYFQYKNKRKNMKLSRKKMLKELY